MEQPADIESDIHSRVALHKGVSFKVIFVIIFVQIVILSSAAYVYVNRLHQSIDSTIVNRLHTVGVLLQDSQLKYTAFSNQDILVELVGEELRDSMIVGVNGMVFHALDDGRLGRPVSQLEGVQTNWFNPSNVEPQIITLEERENTYLISITPIFTLNSTKPFLFGYLKLDSTRFTQQKNQLVLQAILSIIGCIIVTSFLIYLYLRWHVFDRLFRSALFTDEVAAGSLSGRLKTKGADEIGLLEAGLNRMVDELQRRKMQQDDAESRLLETNETLELRVQERTKELSAAIAELKTEADSHKMTSEALKKQSAYIYLLQRIITACNDAKSIDEAWRLAVTTISTHLNWPIGVVYSQEQKGKVVQTGHIYRDEEWRKSTLLLNKIGGSGYALGEGFVGKVLRSGRPQLLKLDTDSTKSDEVLRTALLQGLDWGFAIPVLAGREVVAVLTFFSDEAKELDAELFEISRDIGIQLGRVVERRRAEDFIQDSKFKSDEANRAKTEFITKITHELRTPINAIVGFGQLMQADEASGQKQKQGEHIEIITSAAFHLVRLLDQMTDLAKIESGQIELKIGTVNIVEAVQEVVEELSPIQTERSVTISFDYTALAKDDQQVVCDQNSTKEIIRNVLKNAIFYGGSHKKILITAKVSERNLNLYISDQGQRVEGSYRKEIFKPLVRLDQHRAKSEGLGIGLTLSRELAMSVGGSLEFCSDVESIAVDDVVGNTFVLRLKKQKL